MSRLSSRKITANCDGNPAPARRISFSRKPWVCSREKRPREKRMKPSSAISSAILSRSSSTKERRTRRGVFRFAIKKMVVPPGSAESTAIRWEKCARRRDKARSHYMGKKFVSTNERDWIPAPVPETESLTTLRAAAKTCTACHLFRHATQTVFGEGPKGATLMLVGEQPGDQEDVAGKPFVGPAGKMLDRALEDAGIDRTEVYVTNTVKHFKWEPRGKRRLHKKPNSREIAACRPWLEAELRVVRPGLLVCLGATAAQAIFGPSFRVTRDRGKVLKADLAPRVLATVHPSSLLRQPDEESRAREYKLFVADLRAAVKAAK